MAQPVGTLFGTRWPNRGPGPVPARTFPAPLHVASPSAGRRPAVRPPQVLPPAGPSHLTPSRPGGGKSRSDEAPRCPNQFRSPNQKTAANHSPELPVALSPPRQPGSSGAAYVTFRPRRPWRAKAKRMSHFPAQTSPKCAPAIESTAAAACASAARNSQCLAPHRTTPGQRHWR